MGKRRVLSFGPREARDRMAAQHTVHDPFSGGLTSQGGQSTAPLTGARRGRLFRRSPPAVGRRGAR